jgi:hypothetical protein
MQSLEESLNLKNVSELKDIAREHNISGFSSLKKAELITLLTQNMKSKDFYENLREKLIDTMLIFLDIILEKGNSKKYSELKIDFLDFRSASTFYKIYNQLSFYGLTFEEESDKGDTFIYIPKELVSSLRKLTNEKIKRIEQEETDSELDEKEVESDLSLYVSFLSMEELLESSYLPEENIKKSCINNNIKIEGSKKGLINRLLYDSKIDLEDLLDQLFSKIILQEICVNLQITKSGTKPTIIKRIIEKLPLQKAKIVKKVTRAKAKSVGSVAIETKLKVVAPSIAVTEENLYEDPESFVSFLKNQKFIKPRDERDIEIYLTGVLKTKFGDYKIHMEETGRRGKSRYDITIADTVIIELKVAPTKRRVIEGIGQLITYLTEQGRYKYGVLGVYDSSTGKNLKSQLQEKYGNVYIVIWT